MNIHRPSRSVLRLGLWGGLFLGAALAVCAVPVTTDSGFVVVVSWTQGPGIGLQKQTKLSDVWEDVPDSLGQAEVTFNLTSEVQRPPAFCRLVAP